MKKKLGVCEICSKKIFTLDDSNNIDDACFVTLSSTTHLPIVQAGYGSTHDGDIMYIRDRNFMLTLKKKLEKINELYICDECVDKNKEKFEIFEFEGFPMNPFVGVNPENKYVQILREAVAYKFEELKNISDFKLLEETLDILETEDYVTLSKDSEVLAEVHPGEVLVIYSNTSMEIVDEYAFNRRFVNYC